MRKGIKILVSVVCGLLLVAVLASLSVFLPPVQRFAAKRACEWLGQHLDATVSFEKIRVRPPANVAFDGVYIIDNKEDTILYGNVTVDLRLGRKVAVRRVGVCDGRADIELIISKLQGPGGNVKIAAIDMCRMSVQYDTLELHDFGLDLRRLRVAGDSMSLKINKLSFKYRDLPVDILAPEVTVVARRLAIDEASVKSAESQIFLNDLTFDFPTRTLSGEVHNSTLALEEFGWPVAVNDLNISVIGTPEDLSGELSFSIGEATDVAVAGRWNRARSAFVLTIDSLATTASDAVQIARLVSPNPVPDTLQTMLRRLERFTVTGNVDNRMASLELRTALGDAHVNALISVDNGYSGDVELYNFDIGTLLDISSLGRTTASADITSTSTDIRIARINYKGIDYQDIKARATVWSNNILAHVESRDPRLALTLDGHGYIGRQLQYDFILDLSRADLRALDISPNRRDSTAILSLKARGSNSSVAIDNIICRDTCAGFEYRAAKHVTRCV